MHSHSSACSPPPFHTGLPFSATLTCRGPLAGMVDLSDVRSMSRPWSPRSVFPSPCIIRPVLGKAIERAECRLHSSENANARTAAVFMKRNDPGRQAPSTRPGQGGQRRDKQTAYSPRPRSLSLTFCMFSFSLIPPLCKSVKILRSHNEHMEPRANIVRVLDCNRI